MRAVLWDMDGTLLDSEPAHEAAFHRAVETLGLTVAPGFHAGLLGAPGDVVHAQLVAHTGAALSLDDWLAVKGAAFAEAAGSITRLPAADLVARLAAQGVAQALVSNSTPGEVALCLRQAGLSFAIALSRADVAQGKPDPEGYLTAARRLGVAPADCVVVEDSPRGAMAGVAAGMRVIFHPQVSASPPPGVTLVPLGQPLWPALSQALSID